MIIKANAKINVFLDVLSKREDGYHNLDMVMLPLDLHDSIEIDKIFNSNDNYVVCDSDELLEVKSNLISKTIDVMKEKYHFKNTFNVNLHKEIPICAGLGGGSSNAAATIKAIEYLCKIQMTDEERNALGASLGADVPYCLANVPAHVEGIGDKITPIKLKKIFYVVILKPKQGLSTKQVFDESDKTELKHGNVNDVIKALETGDEKLLANSLFNSLEDVSIKLVPEIQTYKDMLKNDGFDCVLMSGSGTAVFALTTNKWKALKVAGKYYKKDMEVYIARTLNGEKR